MKLFQKKYNKISLVVILSTIVFFLSFILYFIIQTPAQNTIVKPVEKSIVLPVQTEQAKVLEETSINKQDTIIPGIPVQIKIPRIKVDSIIESMGLTPDGEVDSPLGPKNAGWWNGGPIPGTIGSAIIDGHSGWKDNIPAIFDSLDKLEKGDKIYVISDTGITTIFSVSKLKIYGKDDVALDVFTSTDNKSHLNLITCTGIWDNVAKGRDSRIVVFADLIEIKK